MALELAPRPRVTAFTTKAGIPVEGIAPKGAYLLEHYDCLGRPFHALHTWYGRAKGAPPDSSKVGFTARGRFTIGKPESNARMVDMRTLEMMQAGCCPPQIMTEFLETERAEG